MGFNPQPVFDYLESEGRTRIWLAQQLCITTVYLSAILNKRTKPGAPLIKLISIVIGCSYDRLIFN